MTDRNGEQCYQAELYRLKGELLFKQSNPRALIQTATGRTVVIEPERSANVNAERCFHHSIKIAQRQKAKGLELRAAISLARLYQEQSKQREASDLLAQIYAQFAEGFDTRDLREAKALLDELS